MRRTTIGLAIAAVLGLAVPPALAVKPTGAPKPKATVGKTQAPKAQAPKAPKTTTTSHGPKAATAPKSAKATTPPGLSKKTTTTSGSTTTAANAKTKKTTTTTTTTTGGTTSTGITLPDGTVWVPNNDIAVKLSTKPNHLAKLLSVLPAGTNLNFATANFKNFGQLNAAINTALNNPNIQFGELKALMTGTRLDGTSTGVAPISLGQAKKKLQTTPTSPTGDVRP